MQEIELTIIKMCYVLDSKGKNAQYMKLVHELENEYDSFAK